MSLLSLHLFKTVESKSFSKRAGFGLIELMVCIGIISLISAIILTRQTAFNGAVLLRSEAYKIALALREVQLSAVSAESNGGGSFRATEGIYFNTNSSSDGVYKIFRDANNNSYYDTSEQVGKQGVVDRRFEVREIRPIGDTMTGTGISVVFTRPNFDARFYDGTGAAIDASRVEIDISKRDETADTSDVVRTIEITKSGQITVK